MGCLSLGKTLACIKSVVDRGVNAGNSPLRNRDFDARYGSFGDGRVSEPMSEYTTQVGCCFIATL